MRKKLTKNGNIDGITGASDQVNIISRDFETGSKRRFRLCLEIDRSRNNNAYFDNDRPSFIYKSEIIDVDNLQGSYSIASKPFGWMSNDTTGTYGQQPNLSIPNFTTFRLMTDVIEDNIKYVVDSDGDYNDLITNLTLEVTKL